MKIQHNGCCNLYVYSHIHDTVTDKDHNWKDERWWHQHKYKQKYIELINKWKALERIYDKYTNTFVLKFSLCGDASKKLS
jgi:hypothetical protein